MKVRLSSLRAFIQETLLSEADNEAVKVKDNPDIVFNLQELQKLDDTDLRRIDRDVTNIASHLDMVDTGVIDTIEELKLRDEGGAQDEEGYDERRAIINALENVWSLVNGTRRRLKSSSLRWNFVAIVNIFCDILDQFMTDIDELTETVATVPVVESEDVDDAAAEVLNLWNSAMHAPRLAYKNVKKVVNARKTNNRKR
jgi:hypothetical protein